MAKEWKAPRNTNSGTQGGAPGMLARNKGRETKSAQAVQHRHLSDQPPSLRFLDHFACQEGVVGEL